MMIHLHTHTRYSPMDGLLELSDLINLAKNEGHPILRSLKQVGFIVSTTSLIYAEKMRFSNYWILYKISGRECFLLREKKGLHALYELVSMIHAGASELDIISFLSTYENEITVLSDDIKFLKL